MWKKRAKRGDKTEERAAEKERWEAEVKERQAVHEYGLQKQQLDLEQQQRNAHPFDEMGV